ncbi:23S rRNA (adenine(2503)-C(2))-methyltransferase RlmN [Opitutus terrae]|uniref:Probable dual-specificity RNA methyltransferase RlmN 1 n=1 Tax=Opitutus terrae (strain DSM 11246 / JCM 15787 / PB90-1) TaxID=452637 RepID=RLMN1_OPITP|nr:23S rRNA (adenine(2503)-C(2))-methyltransferase RlmN [Opitutus terrae]B1ZQZ5.1 RecName: Full=Probable dual-specificity RNA methyltransferase RlmN 1; AltName: Full=23S rRNA (adenine(2503)-C(2))-methyltransferase 1; AltName: Full=23S rRNA m2A2503 methyltransferase 1; AltName: Full=Ribosomal RNA large subunit methyltransferase N 1; AltName: Full=tRNA (adenine(37)-C(2))-methyltransferase 1; AltName: Full=tRNA m2A37 methyltransferase 1 [Opitutus terrae PB90-1]ACB73662.1 radical SAM enzyme, Cfr fami
MRPSLAELSVDDLASVLAQWGYKRSHAGRVLREYYARCGELTEAGRPWPAGLLERLRIEFAPGGTALAARQVAADGTTKLLLRLADGRTVEAVLMPDYRADRAAGCLSSQVGCAMGCDFCATAQSGFERNLTAGEMVEQFLALRREAASAGRKLQTVVFMGMGEPLLNLDAVLTAVRRIADNTYGGLGWRQVTVSTVGLVPGIDALTAADLGINLAVSLHAPDDATRAALLPAGRRFAIADILAAVDRFQASRGRPVIIQYCLLKGVNDSAAHARMLAAVIGSRRMHVNLLHYNPTGLSLRGVRYEPSGDEAAAQFLAELRARGVVTHLRRSRGPDIDAACGQLRAKRGELSVQS